MRADPQTWLFKTEPHTYSFETLAKVKKTHWDQVRNYQARNFLNQCLPGDFALIYHSGTDKAVVGLSKITKAAYPDPDPEKKGDWVQVDLKYSLRLAEAVPLSRLKSTPSLKNLMLIKQSQLSCMKITPAEFETILKLGQSWDAFQKLK